MTTRLLPRQTDERPALRLWGEVALATGRVHEICGRARRTMAVMAIGATEGPVIWLQAGWRPERLNAEAMAAIAEPGRLVFGFARRPEDLLWSMEEVLRSGAVGLVVADLPEVPGLTPMRRLQLAAEGAAKGRPLGLVLTDEGGAAGAESRWRMEPDHAPGQGWRVERLRARAEPPKAWRLAGGALAGV